MKIVQEERIHVMEGDWSPVEVIREVVNGGAQEEPFYVLDLGEVVARHRQWKELMPRVEPFYAMKCNDDKLLLRTLAALGTGFDCASKAEIQLITSLGVEPERIIFANPAKLASHIRYARAIGVHLMTFDSETELRKIKQNIPDSKLVVRIRCDASEAQCPLGIKFGCDPVTEAPRLLKLAAVMGLEVVGVSFHVGSGAYDTQAYSRGIKLSSALFTLGAELGHKGMKLLDIGGGFPGNKGTSIREVSQVVSAALAAHFPDESVRVIAEPGRYYAAAAYTLAAMVHAKREVLGKESDKCDSKEPVPERATVADSNGNGVTDADAWGNIVADACGKTDADARGNTVADACGKTDADARGNTVADACGKTDADARGNTVADACGKTDAHARGKTDAHARGNTVADACGNNVADTCGNTVADLAADADVAHTMYFINDGVYGSFNCVLYDHQQIHVETLDALSGAPLPCSVWGPSCDALDCVLPAARLPPLALGAWLVFRDMGAYTLPIASPFNGFPVPKVRALIDRHVWSELKGAGPLTEVRCEVISGGSSAAPSASPSPPPSPAPPKEDSAVFVECALK